MSNQTDAETMAAYEREIGLNRVLHHLRIREPGRAHYELMRTFLHQARILNIPLVDLPGTILEGNTQP